MNILAPEADMHVEPRSGCVSCSPRTANTASPEPPFSLASPTSSGRPVASAKPQKCFKCSRDFSRGLMSPRSHRSATYGFIAPPSCSHHPPSRMAERGPSLRVIARAQSQRLDPNGAAPHRLQAAPADLRIRTRRRPNPSVRSRLDGTCLRNRQLARPFARYQDLSRHWKTVCACFPRRDPPARRRNPLLHRRAN